MKRPALTAAPFEAVVLCGISPPFGRLSPARGNITHVLLTRAPLYRGRSPFSCDLHVLGAPLTFVLSQDQTLQLNLSSPLATCPYGKASSGSGFGNVERRFGSGTVNLAGRYLARSRDPLVIVSRTAEAARETLKRAYDSVFKDRGSQNGSETRGAIRY
jgi:hypothetical protein